MKGPGQGHSLATPGAPDQMSSAPILDTWAMNTELAKPDHLDPATWVAIEQHRARFAAAYSSTDKSWALGSAKELVESVARAVCDAKGVVVASGDDFNTAVNSAHVALARQPGPDVSMTPEILSIAGQAKKMILNLRSIRNDFGTGHGRANVVQIDAEMASVVYDATLLWVRWALRRLEHILIGEADLLLAELREAIVNKRSLERHLAAVMLSDQPSETQHALGAAFAQRSAGWTFVTREVGVDPCVESQDLVAWSAEYRLGVVEGFIVSRWGTAGLDPHWVPTLVSVLLPVPPRTASAGLAEITEKVAQSERGTLTPEASAALVTSMEAAALRLPPEVQPAWAALTHQLESAPELEDAQ